MKRVHLYQRSGCSLCEAVASELDAMHSQHQFEVITRDVDSDEEWYQKYNLLVPVITDADENELCHYFLDSEVVAEYFSSP